MFTKKNLATGELNSILSQSQAGRFLSIMRSASLLSTSATISPTIAIETNDRIIFIKSMNESGLVVTRSISTNQ